MISGRTIVRYILWILIFTAGLNRSLDSFISLYPKVLTILYTYHLPNGIQKMLYIRGRNSIFFLVGEWAADGEMDFGGNRRGVIPHCSGGNAVCTIRTPIMGKERNYRFSFEIIFLKESPNLARWISEETGGELFRIVPEESYGEDYGGCADRAKKNF